jgi:hypothetical protein
VQNSAFAESVTDRDGGAEDVVGVELKVILNVVVVNFGADKDVRDAVPNVVADTTAELFHEVIAANVAGAPKGATNAAARVHSRQIEAVAFNAHAGGEIEAEFPGQLGLVETIHVGEDRAVGFVTIVAGALISPGSFCIQAIAFPQKYIDTNAGKDSTLLLWWNESLGGSAVLEGEERAATNGNINLLLAVGETGEKKHGACERNGR